MRNLGRVISVVAGSVVLLANPLSAEVSAPMPNHRVGAAVGPSSWGGTGGSLSRERPGAAGVTLETLQTFTAVGDVSGRLIQGSDGKLYAAGSAIFRVNPDGTALEVLRAFSCESDGCAPGAGLTAGRDGKLYGTTWAGGAAGGGTVFRLNPDGTGFEVLHAFTCEVDGCSPYNAGLTEGRDGKFYGTTFNGGAAGGGTVFRLNPDGTGFEVLHAFTCSDWCTPAAGLTAGSDGKFYGTTFSNGGAAPGGAVFRLNPDGTGFEVLHLFSCESDGCNPIADLTAGGDGRLYGTTSSGGAASGGTVFQLNPDGTGFTVLHSFTCESDGCGPFAGLTAGGDGKFYGTTAGPGFGGTVFRLDPDGSAFEVLHVFACESGEGCFPTAGLTEGRDGKFYGATRVGSALGAIFAIETSGRFSVVTPLGCRTPCSPTAGLTEGRDGKLYGATDGGVAGPTVFRLNPDGTAFEVLHSFSRDGGGLPLAGLMQGRDGKFYGTTWGGGTEGSGTVFRLNPDGTAFEVLHSFACRSDGCFPYFARLAQGRDGTLYGTAESDGAAGGGTVFRLNPDGTAFEVLHSFAPESDGCLPEAGLTQGRDGKLYGTAQACGVTGAGTVFRLNRDGTAFEVLHAFACESDGCFPFAGLTEGRDGKFYGTTTWAGVAGAGTVFRLNPDGSGFEVLHAFSCESGGCSSPFAALTASRDGEFFYGTTLGTAFRLKPDGTGFEVLHEFSCATSGCGLYAGLTAARDGNFYGTTVGGGGGGGTVFRLLTARGAPPRDFRQDDLPQ